MSEFDENVSSYYSPETFIKNCLFLVQSDNVFNQELKRPFLYQIFYTSVQYIANFSRSMMSRRDVKLVQNPNMESGWYLMPMDFAGWVASPGMLNYDFDEYGNWSFKFAGTVGELAHTFERNFIKYLTYYQVPPLNGIESGFVLALRWHFIRELMLFQNSVAQFATQIETRYQEYISIYRTECNASNQKLSANNMVHGYVRRS